MGIFVLLALQSIKMWAVAKAEDYNRLKTIKIGPSLPARRMGGR